MSNKVSDTGYHELNAELNLFSAEGKIQFEKDREAANQFFLQEVNPNTVWFHDLEEKLSYLWENNYYEREVFDKYDFGFIKSLFKQVYAHKFRFQTFMGAFKFYKQYALKTFDGKRYLERFEDRVVANALLMGQGSETLASDIAEEIITGRYQPATPTFLNAGKAQRGEYSSCYLMMVQDDMESISRAITNALQLSKRGGGVALGLTDIREAGAPIKKIENQSSGVVPVMKILEDSFSYANQLGARQGAGAVYLNVHHPDILEFLDTKRENADEKIRIKTLSIGVIIPDITFELARKNEPMYLFSPYSIEKEYGKAFSEISITEKYYELVDNPKIRKKKISARDLFMRIAEIQFESGYPYIMFEDTVNRANPIEGRIKQSNLCVTGDTRLLTTEGYKRVVDLYKSQEDINVLSDNRVVQNDFLDASLSSQKSTKMFKTAQDAEVFKVHTKEGFELKATAWHKFFVEQDGQVVKKALRDLEVGDKLLVQPDTGAFGSIHEPELAYIVCLISADGTFSHHVNAKTGFESVSAKIYLYGDKSEFSQEVEDTVQQVLRGREDLLGGSSTSTPRMVESTSADRSELTSAPLARLLAEYGFTYHTKTTVPEFVLLGNYQTQVAYLSGLFQMDASITGGKTAYNLGIELGSIDYSHLQQVQRLLINLGVYSRIYSGRKEAGTALLPDGHGGLAEYTQQPTWTLRVTARSDRERLYAQLTWAQRQVDAWESLSKGRYSKKKPYATHKYRATVDSIKFHGVEDVYDVTVENGHSVIFDGVSTSQCSEILQVQTPSTFHENGYYDHVGRDISCNLGSMNIAKALESEDFGKSVETNIRALTEVSDALNIASVPTIERGNSLTHSIGLGQMNLHGFLASNRVHYGSTEALDFWNIYMYTVLYHAIRASNLIAQEKQQVFYNFENSDYADGSYFNFLIDDPQTPKTEFSQTVFNDIHVPTKEDWIALRDDVMAYGMYNQYLQAVPPTGSISYINNSTSSIHPVASAVEIRKEGKLGRVYYPAYGMTNENTEYYEDAYAIGYKKIIDTYAVSQKYVDQGQSLTLFFRDTATTRDLNKAYIYAWRKGIKTIYYVRLRQKALDGTEVDTVSSSLCESCQL